MYEGVSEMEKQPKILIVDDDIDFVEYAKTILESKPYRAIVAREGEEALKMALKEKPDLILLDIIMPVKDGFTAAEQLKKDERLRNIPVIMLTSFSTRRQNTDIPLGRGYMLETEDYIEKPISPKDLLARVEACLSKKK
jgi:DNA-binding response OmpR family regulator